VPKTAMSCLPNTRETVEIIRFQLLKWKQ